MRRLFSRMNCITCGHQLCDTSDIFNLEKTRNFPFLSPGGVSHEFITVYKIINFHLIDDKPITENTWFQGNLKRFWCFNLKVNVLNYKGYGWQICNCLSCHSHIGWKFTSTNRDLKPATFWGLSRKSIR